MISTTHECGSAGANASAPAGDSVPRAAGQPLHVPFSWLDEGVANDLHAQFVALTKDVCSGVQTCLELLHSDMLERNANQWADPGQEVPPILAKHHGESLLLLATAATRMLSDQAEGRIGAMNDRARGEKIGGAV
jgi:hypothetical protein